MHLPGEDARGDGLDSEVHENRRAVHQQAGDRPGCETTDKQEREVRGGFAVHGRFRKQKEHECTRGVLVDEPSRARSQIWCLQPGPETSP